MHEALDFAAVLNASPNLYLLLATDLTIIGANEAYLRAAGRVRKELVGRNVFDAFPPDPAHPAGAEQFRASFARVLSTRKPDTIALVKYAVPDPTPGAPGPLPSGARGLFVRGLRFCVCRCCV